MKRRGAVRAGAVGAAVLLLAGARSPAAAQETKSKRVVLGTIGPSPGAERQEPSGLPRALKSINTCEGTLTSAVGSADIGLDPGVEVGAADERLAADLKEFPPVDVFIQEARRNRSEFVQLREGIRAKRRLDNAAGRDVEEIRALVAEEKEPLKVEVTR